MPNPQMQQLYNMFKINPQAFPGVNPATFANQANEEAANVRPTFEQQREAGVLADSSDRAEIGIRSDLEEAQKVRDARNMGFEGSYPLKQQKDEEDRSAMARLLMPKQMELQAAAMNQDATRQFAAGEHDQDRASRESIAAASQQGQNQRQGVSAGNAAAKSVKLGSNPLRSLFGGYMGIDTNEQVQQHEQERVRSSVQSQMGMSGGQSGSSGMVQMVAPDGGPMTVPQDRVDEMEALGARRVQ